jgi:hypothetical protein
MGTKYDMPDNYYFGAGGDSYTTPLALVLLVLSVILFFVLPRKYVIVVFLTSCLLLPIGVRVVIAGMHFPTNRILLLAVFLRFAVRRDLHASPLNKIDKIFLAWAISNAIAFVLLWRETAAVTNRLGFLFTTLGGYFVVRYLIRNKEDVIRTIKTLAVVAIVIAPAMIVERMTDSDLFSLVGGATLSEIRDGKIRAQGPFAHSIIAGTLGAMMIPLFVGLWQYKKRDRVIAGLGIAAGLIMAATSASSTPVLTIAALLLGFSLWSFRKNLQMLRWGLVIALVCLHLIMKAPVWMLIARVSAVLGGSGYHRAMLVDSFIRHFWDWWLIGTRDNASWGYDMWDSINTYVNAGTGGGLVTFVLFLAIIVLAFKRVGIARKMAEKAGSLKDARFIWAIGVCLFANTVAYFGIAYFDQSVMVWYTLLAMISVTTTFVAKNPIQPQPGIAEAKASAFARTMPDEVPVESRQTFASLLK